MIGRACDNRSVAYGAQPASIFQNLIERFRDARIVENNYNQEVYEFLQRRRDAVMPDADPPVLGQQYLRG